MSRRLTIPLIVMAILAICCTMTTTVFAAPPAKADAPKTELVCFNYWPDGVYLGVRFKLVPVGASPEARATIGQAALIEIATEHGRHDLVDRLMKEGVRLVDKATFGEEMGFTPDSLVASSGIGISTAPSSMVAATEELNYSTEWVKRRPIGKGVPCSCASSVCSADVCGKHYCSGECGGCSLCG